MARRARVGRNDVDGRGGRGPSTIAGGGPGARPRAAEERQGSQGPLRGRNDLRDAREARGARSREVDHGVHRAVTRRGDAEDHSLPRGVRRAVGQVASGHAGLGDALRGPLAEGAVVELACAEVPAPGSAYVGHARAAGGEGVQLHGQRTVEEPAAKLGRAVLARVAGGGVPGGGAGGAGSALARSEGAARRTAAAAGRGPAVALRAGRAVVGGYVDAGLERDVHSGVSGRGIARPARVARNDVEVAARETGDRRVRDRERRPEETVRDPLAAVADAAAIRVRCAGLVRVSAGTGAAAPAARGGETIGAGGRAADARPRVHTFARRARPLGAVELAGSVAGDERVAGADVEVGGGSGRGGAARDRAVSPAADIQAGGTEVGDLRRAGGVGVDLAREGCGRTGREARPA